MWCPYLSQRTNMMDEHMTEDDTLKVFTSNIPMKPFQSFHLYALLETSDTKPVPKSCCKAFKSIQFEKATKNYTYKSRRCSKLKVKTIGEIRREHENYVYKYLLHELKNQEKDLFQMNSDVKNAKKDDQVKKILKSCVPISRSSWKMLTNYNMESHPHPKQFVFWSGKTILVTGSKGGKRKIIHNFDSHCEQKKAKVSNNELLKHLPNLSFEPEPLHNQESSHPIDRNFFSKTELSHVTEGTFHNLDNFYHNHVKNIFFKENNQIQKNNFNEVNTFISDKTIHEKIIGNNLEIKLMLDDLINTVALNILEYPISEVNHIELKDDKCSTKQYHNVQNIEKSHDLDVNLFIKCSENMQLDKHKTSQCLKPYSSMGCVCHCGLIPCIFKCEFNSENCLYNKSYISEYVGMENKMGCTIVKEQEFQNKSGRITFSSVKCKNSQTMQEILHKNPCGKLSICLPRIDSHNIEALCMVHELYKCFCKGRFLTKNSNITIDPYTNSARETFECTTIVNSYCQKQNIPPLQKKSPALIYPAVHKAGEQNTINQQHISCPEESILMDMKDINSNSEKQNQNYENEFSSWLKNQYEYLKRTADSGVILEKPNPKDLKLFSYSLLLERYMHNRNFVLVSREPPYRVLIVINQFLKEFKKYINIKNLRLHELHKYSNSVKHFRMNSKLENSFVLLKGFDNYWEILGLVSKCTLPIIESVSGNGQCNELCNKNISPSNQSTLETLKDLRFKWFVMSIKNDFTLLRSTKTKFLISYREVITGINMSRCCKKGSFLSFSDIHSENINSFGIYAVPAIDKDCIWIGPYEIHDELCIEINTTSDESLFHKPMGTWKSLPRHQNILQCPPFCRNDPVQVDNGIGPNKIEKELEFRKASNVLTQSNAKEHSTANAVKLTEPIIIQRNKHIHKITTESITVPLKLLNKAPLFISSYDQRSQPVITRVVSLNPQTCAKKNIPQSPTKSRHLPGGLQNRTLVTASTERIKRQLSQVNKHPKNISKCINDSGKMPEDLGSKIGLRDSNFASDKEVITNMDMKSKLKIRKHTILDQEPSQSIPIPSICEVDITFGMGEQNKSRSIDFKDLNTEKPNEIIPVRGHMLHTTPFVSDNYKSVIFGSKTVLNMSNEVKIVCENIKSLGFVLGRRNENNQISFKFPGHNYTNFFGEEEAFTKINQVLASKVFLPNTVKPTWRIVAAEEKSNFPKSDEMQPYNVTTKHGLEQCYTNSEKRTISETVPEVGENVIIEK